MPQVSKNLPPLPFAEEKRPVSVEVNKHLFDLVEREMNKRKLKIRQVVEWGLRAFLDSTQNPEKKKLEE